MVASLIDSKEGHERVSGIYLIFIHATVASSTTESVEMKKKKRKAEDVKLDTSKGKRKSKG
jgi:hypothetical protein